MNKLKIDNICLAILNISLLFAVCIIADSSQGKKEVELIKYYEELLETELSGVQLNELFPVPEKWKEYYSLQEQGMLPPNISIESMKSDKSKELLFNKIRFYKEKIKGISYFESSIIKRGSHKKNNEEQTGLYLWLREHTLKRQYNPFLFKLYIQYLKKKYADHDIINCLSLSMKSSILFVKEQPAFFKEEYEYLKSFIPELWRIAETGGQDVFSTKIKYAALGSLYLLDEDLNKIIKTLDNLKPGNDILIFRESLLLSDVVNKKSIMIFDIRLKDYYSRCLKSEQSYKNILAFEYFRDIGEIDRYLEEMISFTKNNMNLDGLRTFKILLARKNLKEVKELATYYKNNLSKIEKWSRSGFRTLLEEEFNIKIEDEKKW